MWPPKHKIFLMLEPERSLAPNFTRSGKSVGNFFSIRLYQYYTIITLLNMEVTRDIEWMDATNVSEPGHGHSQMF